MLEGFALAELREMFVRQVVRLVLWRGWELEVVGLSGGLWIMV